MEQQRNQNVAQEQKDLAEEIQHGPFPVEQLQVLPALAYLFVFDSNVAPRIMGTPQILGFHWD